MGNHDDDDDDDDDDERSTSTDLIGYQDESDLFYALDPVQAMEQYLTNASLWRDTRWMSPLGPATSFGNLAFVVLFEALEKSVGRRRRRWPLDDGRAPGATPDLPVSTLLHEHGFEPVARLFNTHWHDDPRRRGDVVVYQRT